MKSKLLCNALLAVCLHCAAFGAPPVAKTDDVLTKIPDPVFQDYCQLQMGDWDTDKDDKLSPEEAAAVKTIYFFNPEHVESEMVKSLSGIEYFTGLTKLICDHNKIIKLDVSHNPKLEKLICNNNRLIILDLSHNPRLKIVDCSFNLLAELFLENNTALTGLWCHDNKLRDLDISDCKALKYLSCYNNFSGRWSFEVRTSWPFGTEPPENFTTGSWKSGADSVVIWYRRNPC